MTSLTPKGGVAPVSRRVMNLSHVVRQAARRHSAEVGLVWGDMTWTWAVLDRRIDAMAAALAAKGIGKGDRVLVQSKNCNQLFELMFACFRLGRGLGADQLPANARRGCLPRRGQRRPRYDLPQRFRRPRRGRARDGAWTSLRGIDRPVRLRRRV